tara:strand:- start:612 stop:1619 length:1008 start_codon:yes stop_codon:yes gene_type:complete
MLNVNEECSRTDMDAVYHQVSILLERDRIPFTDEELDFLVSINGMEKVSQSDRLTVLQIWKKYIVNKGAIRSFKRKEEKLVDENIRGKSTIKIFKLIGILNEPDGISINKISEKLKINRRSVYRLIGTIQSMGFSISGNKIPNQKEKKWKLTNVKSNKILDIIPNQLTERKDKMVIDPKQLKLNEATDLISANGTNFKIRKVLHGNLYEYYKSEDGKLIIYHTHFVPETQSSEKRKYEKSGRYKKNIPAKTQSDEERQVILNKIKELKYLREILGISAKTISEFGKISTALLSKYENGAEGKCLEKLPKTLRSEVVKKYTDALEHFKNKISSALP